MKYFYTVLFALSVWTLGYIVPRESTFTFLLTYSIAFSLLLIIFKNVKDHHNFIFFISLGILTRVGLLFAVPGLSDHFYRFFWDGVVGNLGFSPYAFTPDQLVDQGISLPAYLMDTVYPRINSGSYYSVHPPLTQKIFQFVTYFTPENIYSSILLIRSIILAAEIGIIYLLIKLLPALHFPQKNALWYTLNPLVILEFSGNLHAEVIMLFFFLYSFWWMVRKRWILFSIFFSAAILSKIMVVLLLPLFIRRLGWRKFFYCTAIIFTITLTAYGWMGLFNYPEHYLSSIRPYFQSFEFNASFYYFFRWIGYRIFGYNMIYWLGPTLMIIASGYFLLLYLLQYLNDKGILIRGLFLFTIFLFASTAVHPRYLLFPIVLCLFSSYRYPIVWSYLIAFSYLHYNGGLLGEKIGITLIEYVILGAVMLVDFKIILWKSYYKVFEI